MPSIFARARPSSSKAQSKTIPPHDVPNTTADEFGRVRGRVQGASTSSRDRDDEYAGDRDRRSRAQIWTDKRRATDLTATSIESPEQFEDGFLPTTLSNLGDNQDTGPDYGYLSHEAHVVLSLEDVERIVVTVSDELSERGLDTPLLFSNSALDLDSPTVRQLISAFLRSHDFHQEARFAGPHALASFLRWGLARPIRVISGVEHRGIISWDIYLQWRHHEHANGYSKTEFSTFINLISPPLRHSLLTLFELLSRLLAHSTSSGLTPPTLASLFGPLLFGLPAAGFHATYISYLHASHATEHILLSSVRLQISQTPSTAPPPRRLLTWVKGYPAMLSSLDSFERPRLGAKMRRVSSVRRNVRMYNPDLVRTCSGWAKGPEGSNIRQSKEWGCISPMKPGGNCHEPRYSDAYRKKMDLPPGFHPQTSLFANSSAGSSATSTASSLSAPPSLSSASSSTSTRSSLFEDPSDETKFRSLTDMRWGEFSLLGFGDGEAAPGALKFDLTESSRTQRASKRATLTWADFSAAGFSQSDASLSQTLQFASPISQSVQQWPAQKDDITRKLKKNVQKALPAFGWDTAPVMDGREEVIEEGFLDVFCDLLYGGGWMDRAETTFRECNWALVGFRSLPSTRSEISTSLSFTKSSEISSSQQDPRTSCSIILFEEFVPAEYRASLISQGSKPRTGLAALLSAKKSNKQWRPAATLNGRPYVVGNVPRTPSAREAEFERLLAGNGCSVTKVLTLDGRRSTGERLRVQTPGPSDIPGKTSLSSLVTSSLYSPPTPGPGAQPPELEIPPKSSSPSPVTQRTGSPFSAATIKRSRFRFVKKDKKGFTPSEQDRIEFDTRLASYSDDELNSFSSPDSDGDGVGVRAKMRHGSKEKRLSKDDAWVDILVSSNEKYLTSQDADMRRRINGNSSSASTGTAGHSTHLGTGSEGRSDPDLASREVAQALASVHNRAFSDDESSIQGSSDWAIRQELGKQVELREPTQEMLQRGVANGHGHDVLDHDDSIQIDEEEEVPRVIPKRRIGYFDLHPERRPVDYQSRPSTCTLSNSHLDVPPDTPVRSESIRGYNEDNYEAASGVPNAERQADGVLEIPAFVDTSPLRPCKKPETAVKMEVQVQAHRRTAALVEMYNEVDKLASSSSALPTTAPLQITSRSRLPIRATAAVASSSTAHEEEENNMVESPRGGPMTETDSDIVSESESLGFSETPAPNIVRYVHGEPLHNVLEEREEEEES